MNLPNILIVGAAKSGTTSLHNYLNQHPDIFMCNPKEPHFLINNEIGPGRIPGGVLHKHEYENLFTKATSVRYRGESSVMYLTYPKVVIKNIKKYLSDDVKIIIMLRNPVERAYSGYQHVKRYNLKENLSFNDALDVSEERYSLDKEITPASRYLEIGNYYKQVKLFKESFDNIHVIIYDDYKLNINKELEKVFSFLSLTNINIDTRKKFNQGGWQWKSNLIKNIFMKEYLLKRIFRVFFPNRRIRRSLLNTLKLFSVNDITPMNSETRNWLKAYYKDDVSRLSTLLSRDLNNWTL